MSIARVRQAIRRISHRRAIRHGTFGDIGDPLFARLAEWVRPGDSVIDVGAAVGDYTLRLSELVGPEGWVFALEPVPEQFELLVANVRLARHRNVVCLQLTASDRTGSARMSAPQRRTGRNWYQSRITTDGYLKVAAVRLDELPFGTIGFIKIDAEGHDAAVLAGAEALIARDRPAVLTESAGEALATLGYRSLTDDGSPNRVLLPG